MDQPPLQRFLKLLQGSGTRSHDDALFLFPYLMTKKRGEIIAFYSPSSSSWEITLMKKMADCKEVIGFEYHSFDHLL